MSEITSAWFAIFLDIMMIVYTLWILSFSEPRNKLPVGIGMLCWLALLHLGLSTKSVFPADISGPVFLIVVFLAVGAVGGYFAFGRTYPGKAIGAQSAAIATDAGYPGFFRRQFSNAGEFGWITANLRYS